MQGFMEHINAYSAIYTFAGTLLTAAAFVLTLLFLWRAKKAAEAAESASKKTRDVLGTYDLLVELPLCISYLSEMVQLIRKDEYEAALIRANDCKDKLIKLLQADYFKENVQEAKQIHRQVQILGTIIVSMNKGLKGGPNEIDFSEAVRVSTATQSVLSKCIGKAKGKA